jgi:hypothetical protein
MDLLKKLLGIRTAKMSRVEVFKKLKNERDYQQGRWDALAASNEYGVCETRLGRNGEGLAVERYHELGAWISFMETYLEEARDLNSKTDDKDAALLKVRAVGALAVAALEQHGCPDRPKKGSSDQGSSDQGAEAPSGPAYHGEQPNGCPSKDNCPVHKDGGIIDQLKAAGLIN